jgi:4-amino-4-deoxy-L-arabinose transferase-like glycosyltransferase
MFGARVMRPAPAPAPAAEPPGSDVRRELAFAAGFVLLVAAGLLVNLGTRPIEMEEPRRALVALEMALRGNLLVPTTNGALYVNKPPVFNWVLLAFMRAFGSTDEWVLRLPTVVSMLLAALLLFAVARRHLERRTALTAAAFQLTFTTLLFYGSLYGEIDVFYALLVMLQALAVFLLEQRGRPVAMFVLSYLAAAAGFLTKGMPSVAVQALTLGVWLIHARRWRWLVSWAHLAGLAAFALCVGGYLAAYAWYADPAPYLAKLLFDAAERTAPGGELRLGRTALQLVGFPLQLAALALPWVVFAPGLLSSGARARIRSTPFLRFCVVFLAANVAPYWVSPGNRPRYMFIFLPFLAALLAVGLEQLDERGWYLRALRRVMCLALTAAAVLLAALPFTPPGAHLGPRWAWAAVVALLAGLAVACWRARTLRPALAALLLGLATARVGYDLVIPELRDRVSPDSFYEEVAAVLNRDFRGERVQLLGRGREEQRTVPILGLGFTFREHEWFPLSLSFYYSEERRELLRYADQLEAGGLYLVHPDFRVGRRFQVVRAFGSPGADYPDLSLIRVLE